MNQGVRRLLFQVLKFVVVPVSLLLLGYLVVGPFVAEHFERSPKTSTEPNR